MSTDSKKSAAPAPALSVSLPSVPAKPEPLPEIPAADLQAARELLAEQAKREALADNWGPGKPGKRRIKVPAFPVLGMGEITINGIKYDGRETLMTYDTMENVMYLYDQRIRFEKLAIHGVGRREKAQENVAALAAAGFSANVIG